MIPKIIVVKGVYELRVYTSEKIYFLGKFDSKEEALKRFNEFNLEE